jgi:hypothetical protein
MKRLLVVTSAAVGVIVSAGGVADAGPPANQACHGESISVLASNQAAPGGFGAATRTFAQDPNTLHPGLGDGIELLHAGLVDDEVVPNTCND